MASLILLRELDGLSFVPIPLAPVPASCGYTGFPSPAADYEQVSVTLDEFFGINKNTTWFFRAEGSSMTGIGIDDGDILIVEATMQPQPGDICICEVDGEYLVKILDVQHGKAVLVSANEAYAPLQLGEGVHVFGVVTGKGTRYRRAEKRTGKFIKKS